MWTLQVVAQTLWDAEGIENADVDITSRPLYSQLFVSDRGLLSVIRAGAVHSTASAQCDRSEKVIPVLTVLAVYPRFCQDREAAAEASPNLLFRPSVWMLAPNCTSQVPLGCL